MKPDLIKLSTLALLPVAWLILTGCSATTKVDKTTTTAFKEGVPGGVLAQTYQTTATVTAIDPATRQVTLVARTATKTPSRQDRKWSSIRSRWATK